VLALLLLYSEQCLRPAGARFSKLLKLKLGLEFSQEKLKKNLGKFPIFSKVLRRNLGKKLTTARKLSYENLRRNSTPIC